MFNFTLLLIDVGEVLCSSANELQQNSNASSREEYIPQILTVLLEIHRVYILPLWPNVFCLSFYVISMVFLSLRHRRSSSRNVPSSEERGEMAVLAG